MRLQVKWFLILLNLQMQTAFLVKIKHIDRNKLTDSRLWHRDSPTIFLQKSRVSRTSLQLIVDEGETPPSVALNLNLGFVLTRKPVLDIRIARGLLYTVSDGLVLLPVALFAHNHVT